MKEAILHEGTEGVEEASLLTEENSRLEELLKKERVTVKRLKIEVSEMYRQLDRERKEKKDAISQQKYIEEELKKEKKHYFMQYETLGTSFKRDTQNLKEETSSLQQQVELLQQQLAVLREENEENEVLIENLKVNINLGDGVLEGMISPPPPVNIVMPCSPEQRDETCRALDNVISLSDSAESKSLSRHIKEIASVVNPFSAVIASIISGLASICLKQADAAHAPSLINYTPHTTATQSPPSISNVIPSTKKPVRSTGRSPPALFEYVISNPNFAKKTN